ncbi:EpsD family peptidyl-prolyl cis-trans isomerase [Ideonella sp. BN130291]|uniref:EpsD family peptidyl-prolyl cis-trans isomerase n=1 Tax=Ideonella sp. BN130291 TaxID=3112940 RepID=UPI002E26D3BD|nr:EpsD family peptidyl-prolyl cis-trans isomerase [Ideonella sp. BN130291]
MLFPAPGRAALLLAAAAAVLPLLQGCGRHDAAPKSSQIAAKVNEGELSLHQVQYLLQRQPRINDLYADAAPRVALDSLVEQELAAQAAREQGIESDPAFVQGMEAARRELLARMYQEQLAAKVERPGSDEVDRYYDAHPALFGERRIFTVQEFAVDVPGPAQAALQPVLASARSAAEVQAALDRAGLRYRTGVTVQLPENVPVRLLDTLHKLEEGRSMVLDTTPALRVWTVLKTQDARVERAQAREPIQAYLLADRKRRLVSARMGELRRAAQVNYVGRFAQAASAAGDQPVQR